MQLEPARIEEVFTAAAAIAEPAARVAYVERACGGDAALRERVEALLAAHDASASFLQLPNESADATVAFIRLTEGPGTKIGRYKLLEEIGEGGMGVVFMAEQSEPVRRKTALKIIKPGMDSRQVIARFEAERQALAMMDHPNIARVLDAGSTDSGRSYFAMDLVKGVPITEYCDARRLTPRQRLELFIPVCQAVQHAHQKGIIHRDIKPSNVLVAEYDGRPVPKVIDFGVAKAIGQPLTQETLFTQFGQVIGTFEYMSPEQATFNQLDVDTRSDIYSLGVLLYELLAGSTPIDKRRLRSAALDEVLRMIREEEPPRPSTRLSSSESLPTIAADRNLEPTKLRGTVRGELDWIVMKCLEKDRTRRYDSAGSLAADIERHLHDEPVQACPPSAIYRASKFFRRNKVAVISGSIVLASLAAVSAVTSWLYLREHEARRQAEFGSQIFDSVTAFHGNSPEEAEQFLASLTPFGQQMDPRNRAKLYFRLGDLRGRQARWKESATYFAEGLDLGPDQSAFAPWHYYVPVLLRSGDAAGYHRVRQEMIRRFGESTEPRIAECTVKDCLIIPWPDANFEVLSKLADRAVRADDHWALEYFQFAKALLEYRRGNFELAVRFSRVGNATNDIHLLVSAAMVRAMALDRIGSHDEARKALSFGYEYAQLKYSREAGLVFNPNWNDWIVSHALINEAAAMIDPSVVDQVPKSLATCSHPVSAVDNLYYLALEKLRSEGQPGYQQACEVLDLVPSGTPNSVTEFRRSWTWCLGPHSSNDLAPQLRQAKQLLADDSLEAPYAAHLVLGAMLYRMGEYDQATSHLEASLATYPSHPPLAFGSQIYPRLFLSMVKSRRGELQEAQRLLDKAQPAIDEAMGSSTSLWDYRTTIDVLHREATSLSPSKVPIE